jgi:hypothetical protein
MSQAFRPEAAFAGAAERFFELMKSFAPQGAAAGGSGSAAAADPSGLAGALTRQYEEWLRTTQAAGSWFTTPAAGAAAGAFTPGATAWPFAPLPLGMGAAGAGAAAGAEGQRSWELFAQLAQLQAQLAAHCHEIATTASQQFMARLGATAGAFPGEAPTLERSLELYELWVDCAEEAYASVVHREEFARLQSQLANVSAALLVEQRRHAEMVARAFGLPTRTEIDGIYAQLKELQKRLGTLMPGAGPIAAATTGEAANEGPGDARGAKRPARAAARGASARKGARSKSRRGAGASRGRRA